MEPFIWDLHDNLRPDMDHCQTPARWGDAKIDLQSQDIFEEEKN